MLSEKSATRPHRIATAAGCSRCGGPVHRHPSRTHADPSRTVVGRRAWATLGAVSTSPSDPRSSFDELEQRLARETEIAQRRRERALRDIQRREAVREFDAVKRRRGLRYLMLFTVLTLTAVLVTVVMFRALTFVFS